MCLSLAEMSMLIVCLNILFLNILSYDWRRSHLVNVTKFKLKLK